MNAPAWNSSVRDRGLRLPSGRANPAYENLIPLDPRGCKTVTDQVRDINHKLVHNDGMRYYTVPRVKPLTARMEDCWIL
jgi:hypothetical protein